MTLRVATLDLEARLITKNLFMGSKKVQNSINIDLSIHEESWKLFTSNECQIVVLSLILEIKLLNFFFLLSSF